MERKTYFTAGPSRVNPEVTVLKIDGFIDVNAVPEFEQALESLLQQGHVRLVLDFSAVTYISSAGMGAIVGSLQTFRNREPGDIKIMQVLPKIMTVFRSIGLHDLVDVLQQEEEIIHWLPRRLEADFDHFTFAHLDERAASGREFNLRVQACLGGGETAVDFHGEPKISSADGLVLPRELRGFEKGVWEGKVLTTGTGTVRLTVEDSGRSSSFEVLVTDDEPKAVFPQQVACRFCGTQAQVRTVGIYRCRQCNEIFYTDPWAHVITLHPGKPAAPKTLAHKGVELKINSDLNYLTSVRRFLAGLCEQENLAETVVNEVVLATEEVLLNIIEHGYNFNPAHAIDLRLKILPQRLEIRIRDRGKTFDVTQHKRLSLKSIISHGKKGGMGAVLINQLMDGIQYRRCHQYNQLVMSKRLQRKADFDRSAKNADRRVKT
jgi:anti-sigma B factor antagonist